MNKIGFNPDEVEAAETFEAMPAGIYGARFKECEIKDTRAGTGQYLQIVWEIQDPAKYANRLVWDRLNIHNPNSTAQDIGRRAYKQMTTAMGMPVCEDPDVLVDKFCMLKLTIEDNPGYEAKNAVKGYMAIEGAHQAAPAPQPRKPAATSAAAPPWARGKAA